MQQGKVACGVLAAGASLRFGLPKQLATISSKSLIQIATDAANGSKAEYVLAVLGGNASEIMEKLKLGRAQVVFNKDYKSGIASSIKVCISNLPPDTKAVVLMVADQPFLSSRHLNRLINAFQRGKSGLICLARAGEPRNPMIFERKYFPELMKLKGDTGAKRVMEGHHEDAILINIRDPKIFLDIDSQSDLEALKREKSGEKS